MSDFDRIFDEYLVIASKAGDREAGERLAARWLPRLLRTARRVLGDAALAEDVVQEAWLGLTKGLTRLDDPTRFPAFAFRILNRRCTDAVRGRAKARSRLISADSVVEKHAAYPASDRGGPEMRVALQKAFDTLPSDQRTAAALYFGEDLTVAEIAIATEAPVGTVKSRLYHARKKLKSVLEGDL